MLRQSLAAAIPQAFAHFLADVELFRHFFAISLLFATFSLIHYAITLLRGFIRQYFTDCQILAYYTAFAGH